MTPTTRPISWIKGALREFETFPEGARSICLAALTIAAEGGKADIAKPMRGLGSGVFEIACAEGDKRFPSGGRRLDNPIHQRRMAEMSAQIEAARALLHAAAAMADAGRAASVLPFLQAKVVCAEVGVRVTTDLMTLFGGTAFAGHLPFERYFRDARAGLVMGQANDVAYGTIGTLLFPALSSDAGLALSPTS